LFSVEELLVKFVVMHKLLEDCFWIQVRIALVQRVHIHWTL